MGLIVIRKRILFLLKMNLNEIQVATCLISYLKLLFIESTIGNKMKSERACDVNFCRTFLQNIHL